ncbi:hypothetical protein [Algoriphagus aquimarinus]|uniref:hypothetical protein n=1 Tax=Algoriphagus aquimarinus TaxID=237018 RepID=UPI0030D72C70|tara:strand:- start:120112 stop:120327 length:216 start_codon:yes stop_codon:yes gene_type:complete
MEQDQSEHRSMGPFGPGLEEVNNFFAAQDFPAEDGEVFYFYYQALGWCNENGMPLRDWRAAAYQWLWNLEH